MRIVKIVSYRTTPPKLFITPLRKSRAPVVANTMCSTPVVRMDISPGSLGLFMEPTDTDYSATYDEGVVADGLPSPSADNDAAYYTDNDDEGIIAYDLPPPLENRVRNNERQQAPC